MPLVEQVLGTAGCTRLQQKLAEKIPCTHVPYYNAVKPLTAKFREIGSVVDELRHSRTPVYIRQCTAYFVSHIAKTVNVGSLTTQSQRELFNVYRRSMFL
jgi:hypothetical protein